MLFLSPQLIFVRSALKGGKDATRTEPYEFSIKCTLRPPKTTEEDIDAEMENAADKGKDEGGATK